MGRGPVPSASGAEQAAVALGRALDGAEDLGGNQQEVIDGEGRPLQISYKTLLY